MVASKRGLKASASVVVASLVGACAIHFALTACSNSARGGSTDGTPDAFAQASPACSSWQIAVYYAPDILSASGPGNWPSGLSSAVTLPSGWEPIQATPFGGTTSATTNTVGALAVLRKCAQ